MTNSPDVRDVAWRLLLVSHPGAGSKQRTGVRSRGFLRRALVQLRFLSLLEVWLAPPWTANAPSQAIK